MKRLRGIGVQLVIFFVIAISIPTFMLAIDVVVTTKSTQRSNMQLTSEQTLQETKKGFETYLKTLSQPIDLLTRKNEVKHLEDQGPRSKSSRRTCPRCTSSLPPLPTSWKITTGTCRTWSSPLKMASSICFRPATASAPPPPPCRWPWTWWTRA